MIKLFRKIRHKLLREENFKKYLIYAIGEIVLVVIGILIALTINNRNEVNKARNDSKVYIQEIADDLTSDTKFLSRIITNLNKQISTERWFLNKTGYTIDDFDSLKMIVPVGTWDFYLNQRTYNKIQNSQNSKLTGFDEVYQRITDYYTVDRARIERNSELEIRASSMQNDIMDTIHKTIEINDLKTIDLSGVVINLDFPSREENQKSKNEFVELMNTIEARNYIKQTYSRHQLLLLGFDITKRNANELIEKISELEMN